MRNESIRTAAAAAGVRLWEIAEALGITDATFSRKLRHEFSEEESMKIMKIIENLRR